MLWGRSITYLFVMVWIGVGVVWIVLDWIGNPSRGAFRPIGRRNPLRIRDRLTDRSRRRSESDAAIRATLRERYGRSSLRLLWNDDREGRAAEADFVLVSDPLNAVGPREPELPYGPLLLDEKFEPETEPETEPDPSTIIGWSVGVHPLARIRNGGAPTPATVRSRVWKNHAHDGSWGPANSERMRSGKPPRRFDPRSGRTVTAKVDLETAMPYWPDRLVDPFIESKP